MKQYAFVNSNGEVGHTISPALDSDYTPGVVYDGLTCVEIGIDADPLEYLQTKLYIDNAWVTRTTRPSPEHDWDPSSTSWVYNSEQGMAKLRKDRNLKLTATDWTQIPDNSLTEEQVTEARTYRTSLRNITNGITLPLTEPPSITWPTPPSFLG